MFQCIYVSDSDDLTRKNHESSEGNNLSSSVLI